MPNYTSATQRLCELCIEIRRLGNTQGGGTPLRAILVDLGLAESGDLGAAHQAYLGLVALAREARDEVYRLFTIVDDPSSAISTANTVARTTMGEVYAIFVGNSIHSTASEFLPIQVDQLGMLASIATRDVREEVATEALIDSFRERLDAVASDVLASALPGQLKEHVVDAIERLRRALATYRIYGNVEIDRAVGEVLVVSSKGLREVEGESGELFTRAINVAGSIATVLEWLKISGPNLLPAADRVAAFLRLVAGG